MKRQDPSLSSSSRRETSPAPENMHAKSIGCMSGLFHLVSKYHKPRRLLTFGKNREKSAVSASAKPQKTVTISSSSSLQKGNNVNAISHLSRFSCEEPRSPTLPAEIRRSNLDPQENFRTSPALVARLMGLNETPATMAVSPESMVVEKKRILLGALKKCDEDLKALKKMIEVVKSVGDKSTDDDDDDDGRRCPAGDQKGELQPSPVSVLDEFTRSAFSGYSKRYTNVCIAGTKEFINGRSASVTGRIPLQQKKKKPGDEEDITNNICFINRPTTENNTENYSPLWTSKAMVESVNEVCRDISWGERREIGRIGLALQDHIFRDLIEEIVREMGFCGFIYPLPFESCKRRLSF